MTGLLNNYNTCYQGVGELRKVSCTRCELSSKALRADMHGLLRSSIHILLGLHNDVARHQPQDMPASLKSRSFVAWLSYVFRDVDGGTADAHDGCQLTSTNAKCL